MNTRMTTTTPGEGTPPTSAPSHSHGGQGHKIDIASSGTQGNQDSRDSNTIASSGTTEFIGEASSGTVGTDDTKGNQGTFKGKNASSGTSGSAPAAHQVASTQQDNSDFSESSGQSLNTNKKKGERHKELQYWQNRVGTS